MTERERDDYVYESFFTCVKQCEDLNIKVGQTYWFEHIRKNLYQISSYEYDYVTVKILDEELLNNFIIE